MHMSIWRNCMTESRFGKFEKFGNHSAVLIIGTINDHSFCFLISSVRCVSLTCLFGFLFIN